MDDPWHQETLEALIVLLVEARRGVRALVVTSSEELRQEVESELRKRLSQERQIVEIHLAPTDDPPSIFLSAVRSGFVPGLVTLVKGLTAGSPFLRYLNLNRELFDREGEAFVFFVDLETATAVIREAPDFNRYLSRFELLDWEDLVASAGASVALEPIDFSAPRSWRWEAQRAAQRVERLRQQGATPGRLAVALQQLATALEEVSHDDQATEVLIEAAMAARAAEDEALLADVLVQKAHLQARDPAADIATVIVEAREAVRLTAEKGTLFSQARAHRSLSLGLLEAGYLEESLVEQAASIRLIEKSGEEHNVALGLRTISWIEHQLGDLEAAGRHAQEAVERSRKVQRLDMEAFAWERLAEVELARGELGDGARALGFSVALARATGNQLRERSSLAAIGFLQLNAGRLLRSEQLISQAIAAGKSDRSDISVQADIHLALGQPAVAAELGKRQLATAQDSGRRLLVVSAKLVYARALEAMQGEGDATALLRAVADDCEGMQLRLKGAEAKRHLARLLRFQNRIDEGEAFARAALATDRRSGARPAEAQDLTELSFLAAARDDANQAYRHAQAALEVLRETRTRFYEPAALAALACAHRGLGRHDLAAAEDQRWRRLVDGMKASGLRRWIERSVAGAGKMSG